MSLQASYELVKTWNSGFKSEITLTNTGSDPIVDWQLAFDFSPQIEDIWRAEVVSQEGDSYVVTGKSYSDTIEPGESLVFSFKATGDPTAEPAFHLDGDAPSDGGDTGSDPGTGAGDSPANDPTDPDPTDPTTDTGEVIEVAAGTSASALQSIIDDAPAGAVVRLAAGDFVFDRTVQIDRDDITIEGAGSGETRIMADFDSGREGPAFAVYSSGTSGSYSLSRDASQGDTTLNLAGGHGFEAGDFVWLEAPNTDEFFAEIGDTSWLKDKPLRTSIARVTEADGDTLTLEKGIHFDYDASEATIRKLDMVENVTLRGFSVDTPLGEPDPGDFSNTAPEYDFMAQIHLVGTYGARLEDIEAHDSGSKAFLFEKTLDMTAGNLLADGSHNKGAGGNGYAFELKDVYESTLTNLEDHGMRHSVIFGSWYSAANNTVHVTFTDRDINFHGGRDHGNVVTVDISERIEAYDNMSSTVSYNSEGERWGAPTDPDANSITFGRVLGTKRDDVVQGDDSGVYLDGRGADDSLRGGAGDDTLVGGSGNDVLDGAGGNDQAVFSGSRSEYDIGVRSDGGLSVDGADGRDTVYGVEWLKFDGETVSVTEFGIDGGSEPPAEDSADSSSGDTSTDSSSGDAIVLTGTSGNDTFQVDSTNVVVEAGDGWDHVEASVDYTMDASVEKLTLMGAEPIDGVGNEFRNVMRGNDAGNMLKGEGGDDELWARSGDDNVYGGAGDDALHGQDGNDMLMGGGGADTLEGGRGADSFRFDNAYESDPGERDTITDFDSNEGDRIDLSGFEADLTFVGGAAFSGTAGELRFADQVLAADVDGDGDGDFEVELLGVGSLAQDELV